MIKDIKVINRFGAELILMGLAPVPTGEVIISADQDLPKWALISINSSDEPFLIEGKNMKNLQKAGLEMVMSIRFDDIKSMDYEKIKIVHPKIILFNEDHARKIIEFIDLAQRKLEPMTLLIHCTAGVSRSGAVATFISEYLNLPFHDENIMPNSYVLETIRKTAQAYEVIKKGDGK